MSKETLPDGRIITGGPTDVKAKITISPKAVKELKHQMYQDFLIAKQQGQIALSYTFDSWLRDSMNMLRTIRAADLKTEWKLGKISEAEYKALDEMRIKMISALIQMDTHDLDRYGVQYIDPTAAQLAAGNSQPLDNRLLVPTHRKNVVKFKREIKK